MAFCALAMSMSNSEVARPAFLGAGLALFYLALIVVISYHSIRSSLSSSMPSDMCCFPSAGPLSSCIFVACAH
ncbi:hypothetical protein BDW68DRAFT_169485 [Aspergillus falconensis]